MSDSINPYESPGAKTEPERALMTQAALTEKMLLLLKEASPWIRFVGIVSIIFAVSTMVSGITTLAASSSAAQAFDMMGMGELGTAVTVFMGLFIIGAGVITLFLGIYSFKFGDRIKSYFNTGADADLEIAFKNSKSYWKLYGIIMIITLAFIALVIIATIIIVAVAATAAASMFW